MKLSEFKEKVGTLVGPMVTDALNEQLPGILEGALGKFFGENGDKQAQRPKIEVGEPGHVRDPKGGWKTFSEFALAVRKAVVTGERDPRLIKDAGDTVMEGDDTSGGHLVAEEHRGNILQVAEATANFASRCTKIPMQTNSVKIPALLTLDKSGGSIYGGIRFYSGDEKTVYTETKPAFGSINLVLKKQLGLCKVTTEMLEDSPISMEPFLTTLFGKAWAWTQDGLLMDGDGVEEPQGILNSPAAIHQERAVAGEVHYDDILNLLARMPGFSKQNAVFVANQEVSPMLGKMTTTTDGTGYPVYLPANGASGVPFATLMGRPIIETEHAPGLGDIGDLSVIDWSQYLIGQKAGVVGGDVQVSQSMHLDFDKDLVAFKFRIRLDGQCWWPKSIKPKKGTNTLSPIVLLGAAA